ncbi:hypothetical protein V8C86DRAFT_1466091 [Haematococcus lacustris]
MSLSVCASRISSVRRKSVVQVVASVGPREKGTKKHSRNRPIKYNPSDRRHKPATYAPFPPPPPEFIVVTAAPAVATTTASSQ